MYPWETLITYCWQDERWFEPVSRHVPTGEFLSVYRALMPSDWRLRRRGLWFVSSPPKSNLPGQGWKLHVCSRIGDGAAPLRAALPVLRDLGVEFKFLVDPWALEFTNGKLWPRGSSGKLLTAYPVDVEEFRTVAGELTTALAGFTGPYILGDRRCPGSSAVYYRYGGFIGTQRLRPDGVADLMITAPDGSQHPDIRHPYWSAPPWVSVDPFGLDAQNDPPDEDAAGGLDNSRFTIESPIKFTNSGGVYRATDTQTGRAVVIKEARPFVGFGAGQGQAIDATELLAKEHRILTTLADVEQFVDPVTFFTQWEHRFLVEEYVESMHLGQVSIGANPLYHGPLTGSALAVYHGRIRDLFLQLADGIAAAHQRNIVLADLSFTNVLVDGDDRVRLIDLEGAVEQGVDRWPGLYTPGVTYPAPTEAGLTPASDYGSLGAMMFGTIMLNNSLVAFHRPALARLLDELQRDLALPADLVALITDLTSGTVTEAGPVRARIAALTVDEPDAWPAVVPLGRPAAGQLVGERLERLRARMAETVTGVTRYIRETASPLRDDRLFPADLGLFDTNPVGVAFGAAGVLRALHRLPGGVPSRLLAWLLERDSSPARLPSGLYFGASGVAWTLADLGQVEQGAELLRRTAEHPLLWEHPDVMHGCSGFGLAALRLWRATGEQRFLDDAVRVGIHLTALAEHAAAGASWRSPDDKIPIGYPYGNSGIALFLLYLHYATGDEDVLRLGREALDFELSQAETTATGLTSFRTYVGAEKAVLRQYWDYGTAGVMTTLARYVAAGHTDLAGWVDRLLPDITRKYAVMPQLFHGLSGIGNAMLDVAEFTGRDDLFAEALRTAEGVLLFAIERDEGVAFPGEQTMRETCDLASGSAGVALFLDRALRAGPGRRTSFDLLVDDLLPGGVSA